MLIWCVSSLFQDILVGYLYVGVFLPIIFPFFDVLDYLHVMHPYCIFLFVTINVLLCIFYPTLSKWSTARGDTTVIFAITTGIFVASWLNFQQGFLVPGTHEEGRIVLELPTVHWLFIALVRLVVGVLFLECVRWTIKKVCRHGLCFLHNVSHKDAAAARRLSIELPYYFIVYSTVGFSAVYTAPILFSYMGIMRDAYYTEIWRAN